MFRKVLTDLQGWLNSPIRKPLVMRGARQVGKTWLVRELAKRTNKQLIEINFENTPEAIGYFLSNNPKKILSLIEIGLSINVEIENSILFLDEIQTYPEILAKLRWFAEDLPELAVVTAGSLLEFVLAKHSFSMPVGRINYFYLEPMSFEEFLLAKEDKVTFDFIQNYQLHETLPDVIHKKIMSIFREYMLIGGMPAAIVTWIKTNSYTQVNQVQHDLVKTYRDDFTKYSGKLSISRLQEILNSVPSMIGEKFVYRKVNKEAQIASLKHALDLLIKARVCHKVHCTSANGVPLAAELNQKSFKIVYIDTGLLCAALGVNAMQIRNNEDAMLVNRGSVSEQIVSQLLRTIEPYYVEPDLYYWNREQKSSSAEIDYVIAFQGKVIPIEVKSGSTGGLKSLHLFMHLKKLQTAVRINADVPSNTPVTVKLHNGETVTYTLLSIPMYFTEQLQRLLANTPKAA